MQNGELPVGQLCEAKSSTNVKKNRQILNSILKTMIFCGKQNIALRGHRELGLFDALENQENFRALL
jgi:hypothetical protein